MKAEDIGEGAVVEFMDGGTNEQVEDKKTGNMRKTFEIKVKLPTGREMTWTMNPRSQGRVAEVFGHQPDQWVGRKVPVYSVKQDVFGDLKDVLYATKQADWPNGIYILNGMAVPVSSQRSPGAATATPPPATPPPAKGINL